MTNQNRQPAGTTGLTANHKGGTFTHKVTSEPEFSYVAEDLEELGLSGSLSAGSRNDSEFLIDVSSVLTTKGGRRIALGVDEEGDPGASMKTEDGEEETFSSYTSSRTQCARYILRDQIAYESARKEFPEETISVGFVSVSDGENPDSAEMEMLIGRNVYHLNHDFYKGETTLGHYVGGKFTEMTTEEVAPVLEEATGKPLGHDGLGFLSQRVLSWKNRMSKDVDADRGLAAALGARTR